MFSVTKTATQLQCVFSSSLELVDRALVEARKFMSSRQNNIKEFEFRLALREALNNAVIHGNHRDEALQVVLTMECDDQSLEITVADQGPGFAWLEKLKQGSANPGQPGGRGIIIIRSSGFSISYNKSGNILKLTRFPQDPA